MESSIQQFMEFGLKKLAEVINNFINDEGMDVGELVRGLGVHLQELQRNLVAETLEAIDDVYRRSAFRKEDYVIDRKDDPNSFMSTCGEINYRRTYFKSKETGDFVHLADEACGITKNMRKSQDVVAEGIKHVIDSSYRISGEHATDTEDIISKQAIMKDIHELEIPDYIAPVKEKRQVKVLYINADEDHVSLQFNKEKGDLKTGKNGRKINNVEPWLACVFEGIEPESESSKRRRLINKHCIAGLYKGSEGIWNDVLHYIDTVYDEEYLEKIYIMGDGAPWIKAGVDVLGAKCSFVLDKFHLNQSIMRAIRHLGDSADDARDQIYDGISCEELEDIRKVLVIADKQAESDAKKEQVRRTKTYIENHWEAIIRPNNDEYARMGCSAEGQVSHILSARLSSRPLGWSKRGVNNMARLRAYNANGGNVYDLLKYQKKKKERQIRQEIREEIDRKIRKKQKTCTDAWSHETVAASIGLVNGLYCATKKLRGICG